MTLKIFLEKAKNLNIFDGGLISSLDKGEIRELEIGKNIYYSVISEDIKKIQNEIAYFLYNSVEVNNSVTAYRKGLSYFDFLEPHKNNYHFLRLDIVSFFYSITSSMVAEVLDVYIEDKYILDEETWEEQKLIDSILNLVTYKIPDGSKNKKFVGKTILPIGFITSPVISNIVFRSLDILIQKICISKNIVYTRYADDMLFSSKKDSDFVHNKSFQKEIAIILKSKGFKINNRKTIKTNHTISLNGYTIQSDIKTLSYDGEELLDYRQGLPEIRLSNKKTLVIKKMLYLINKKEKFETILRKIFHFNIKKMLKRSIKDKQIERYAKDQVINKLVGYRSFILSIIIYNKKKCVLKDSTLSKYITLVNNIEICLDTLKK